MPSYKFGVWNRKIQFKGCLPANEEYELLFQFQNYLKHAIHWVKMFIGELWSSGFRDKAWVNTEFILR